MNPVLVAAKFRIEGNPVKCERFGNGHINQTFIISTDAPSVYVLQWINQYVFKNPPQVMDNAGRVTDHILAQGQPALRFLECENGTYCYRDPEGEYWRCYEYVSGFCMDAPETGEDFYQSAIAFGMFQNQLSDFPADTLYDTIPNFHNTPDRFRQLKETLAADPMGRLETCRPEVEFYLSHEEMGGRLYRMLREGQLPLRVTHNDTKLNNVLLDSETHKPLCVLDLDTVMPGLSAYDFGDSIRFGAATAAEDERDASKMKLDAELFRLYTRGFLEACPALTETEVQVLPLGAFTMTLECGSRFLKDYLDGDKYFRTAYPTHNLVRARTQMAMAADMLARWEEMEQIVAEEARKVRG